MKKTDRQLVVKKLMRNIQANQPLLTWWRIAYLILKYPRNLRVIGPDTGLFNYQIARKLKWWGMADRIVAKCRTFDIELSYMGDHYEAHGKQW